MLTNLLIRLNQLTQTQADIFSSLSITLIGNLSGTATSRSHHLSFLLKLSLFLFQRSRISLHWSADRRAATPQSRSAAAAGSCQHWQLGTDTVGQIQIQRLSQHLDGPPALPVNVGGIGAELGSQIHQCVVVETQGRRDGSYYYFWIVHIRTKLLTSGISAYKVVLMKLKMQSIFFSLHRLIFLEEGCQQRSRVEPRIKSFV